MHEGLYYFDNDISPVVAATLSYSPLQEFMLLHQRLGHMSFSEQEDIQRLVGFSD